MFCPFLFQYRMTLGLGTVEFHVKCLALYPKVRHSRVLAPLLAPPVRPLSQGLLHPCCSTEELLYFAPGGPGLTACFKAEMPRWISRVHKQQGVQQSQPPQRLDGMATSWPNQKGLANRPHFCSEISPQEPSCCPFVKSRRQRTS